MSICSVRSSLSERFGSLRRQIASIKLSQAGLKSMDFAGTDSL
ncbi:hypothetical protein [Rhodopirellula halodulae]|nr:hypothetical protein [Rhodopirellula sp. JC740]